MKIDPQRLQLASAIGSDDSDSVSSREEGEIRSLDLQPRPSPPRDPRQEALYRLRDELHLRTPEFARSLAWAQSLKIHGGKQIFPEAQPQRQAARRPSPGHFPRPSSSSATPSQPNRSSRGPRASSFVLVKSPHRQASVPRRSRSRSPKQNDDSRRKSEKRTKPLISPSPSLRVSFEE
jgi:hypothetical protein